MRLKYSEKQKWMYYPKMEKDEVLVFKSFEIYKERKSDKITSVFHTAFEDPNAPKNAESR